ncbi:MAG: Fic family protein [Clostridiales bacterium]|nr:Fic family protein [Clostridiales bacterium]
MEYTPIFDITPQILSLVMNISERLGEINVVRPEHINPKLRKENRIRTIHSSLAIENNTLSIEQVTAILDGKRILGNPVEIKEVQNAAEAYELMFELNPMKIEDLLRAHKLLMKDLINDSGRFRFGSVGVLDGERVVHIAPPAKLVPQLMENLFNWYKESELPPLVKSAVFHYEFEFIHPFADGNGRMGRMWHTLLLGQWNEVFFWLPIEELIKQRQKEYYDALGESDRTANCTRFIEVMLEIICESLRQLSI